MVDELLVSQRLAFNLKDIKPDPEILSVRAITQLDLKQISGHFHYC